MSPIPIPHNKSLNTMIRTVTINGTNCFQPAFHKALKVDGFASLNPTIKSIAANTRLPV